MTDEYDEIMKEIKSPTVDVETTDDSVKVGVDVNDDGKDDFTFTIKGKVAIAVGAIIGVVAILKGMGLI